MACGAILPNFDDWYLRCSGKGVRIEVERDLPGLFARYHEEQSAIEALRSLLPLLKAAREERLVVSLADA
jgi:hypothetical protein